MSNFQFSFFSNPTSWGPTSDISTPFSEYTYSLFNKNEVVSKCADWTQTKAKTVPGTSVHGVVGYVHEDDDSSFNLVLSKKISNPAKRWKTNAPRKRVLLVPQGPKTKGTKKTIQKKGTSSKKDKILLTKLSTVVKQEWKLETTFSQQQMSRCKSRVPNVEDVRQVGSILEYNTGIDIHSVKNPVNLEYSQKKVYSVTTSEDPIIKELSKDNTANIYITDSILSGIMCAAKAVFSFDVVITNVDGVLFFDKRDKSKFDVATVDETAKDPFSETDDSPSMLFQEATIVQKSFVHQVLGSKKLEFGPNPFKAETDNDAPVSYKYRKFTIGDTSILVRCEVDGYLQKDKPEPLTIRAFNEFNYANLDDWKNNLYDNAASVFMNEVKKNSNRATRWGVQAYLAGTSFVKVGFVSRLNSKIRNKHQILGTQVWSVDQFTSQCVNLSHANLWGVFMTIAEQVLKLGNGKYLLLKEPGVHTSLRLYSVPSDTTFLDDETDVEQSPLETKE